jgi:hypothetical protein
MEIEERANTQNNLDFFKSPNISQGIMPIFPSNHKSKTDINRFKKPQQFEIGYPMPTSFPFIDIMSPRI